VIRRVAALSSNEAAPAAELRPSAPVALDIDSSYRYCEALARARHHNYPVASRFLPAPLRPHVLAIYAFARSADDFADLPEYAGRRERELDHWEDLLHRLFHGDTPPHPVFVALGDTVRRFDLPIGPLLDLIEGIRMDLRTNRYATFGDLQSYVARAAHPLGRLLLYMFGVRDADRHRYAEDLSTALALTSLWQDVALDLRRDHVYIPTEDLRHFRISAEDLFARKQSLELKSLVRFETARARAYYQRARPLIYAVDDQLGVEVAMIFYGGLRALDKIESSAGAVFGKRVSLSTADKAWVLAKSLGRRGAGLLK
jgi:squalene synthase HpnC